MNGLIGNWKTTLFGLVAAFLTYFTQIQGAWPTPGKEWGVACLSAAMLAWGTVGKDASTGSQA